MTDIVFHDDQFGKTLDGAAQNILLALINYYERTLQEMFRAKKTGLFYKVSKRGPLHQASAPGEAPAIVTGRLRQGVRHEIQKVSDTAMEGVVGSTVRSPKYPEFLEYGTSKMAARPAWIPSLLKTSANADKIIKKETDAGNQ